MAEGPHREQRRRPLPGDHHATTQRHEASDVGAVEHTIRSARIGAHHNTTVEGEHGCGSSEIVFDPTTQLDTRGGTLWVRRFDRGTARQIRRRAGDQIEAIGQRGDEMAEVSVVQRDARREAISLDVFRGDRERELLRFDTSDDSGRQLVRDHQEHRADATTHVEITLRRGRRRRGLVGRHHVIERVAMAALSLKDSKLSGDCVVGQLFEIERETDRRITRHR